LKKIVIKKMMTVDNSASFSEGSFQPNDLILQMAELEVCYMNIFKRNALTSTNFLTHYIKQGGLHALLEKVKGDTQMTKVNTIIVSKYNFLKGELGLCIKQSVIGYIYIFEKESIFRRKLWSRYGKSSPGYCRSI
jgi:hypothetical protein